MQMGELGPPPQIVVTYNSVTRAKCVFGWGPNNGIDLIQGNGVVLIHETEVEDPMVQIDQGQKLSCWNFLAKFVDL